MATAQIVRAWQDAAGAHLAAAVIEAQGSVEYIGTIDNATFNALPDATTKKAALVAAVKAVRDAQIATTPTVLGTITGSVAI